MRWSNLYSLVSQVCVLCIMLCFFTVTRLIFLKAIFFGLFPVLTAYSESLCLVCQFYAVSVTPLSVLQDSCLPSACCEASKVPPFLASSSILSFKLLLTIFSRESSLSKQFAFHQCRWYFSLTDIVLKKLCLTDKLKIITPRYRVCVCVFLI